ncbi:MAG: 4-hydroxybenzoate polyprenyltransferase [Polaribacter sp.]|jgi:4-hydroxybenzoate polyprenyltransferase
MKVLKKLVNFYINASIHVAFAVFSFLKITEIYFDLSYDKNIDYFVFFGTITGYNFVKYAGVAKLHHKSLTDDLKIIQIFSLFCFLVLCYFGYIISLKTLLFSIPFSVLTILYAVPFLSGLGKNLRQISYLKIMVVAIVWSGFTVLLPFVDSMQEIPLNTVFLMLQRFLIVVVLILPFDIRDVQYDSISLQTIPKKIGIAKTKRLGLLLMIFSLILEYLFATESFVKTPFMIFFFLVILLLMRAKTTQSKYYSSFWVESLPIVWWLLLLGFHNF